MKKTNIIIKKLQESSAKIIATLKNIGLSQNEINIYLASLSIGQSAASILGKKVGLNRNTAQYTCQSLVSKKIMSMIKKDNYYLFWSENPRKIISIIQKEEDSIQMKKEALLDIIGDLKNITPLLKKYQCCNNDHNILEKCE